MERKIPNGKRRKNADEVPLPTCVVHDGRVVRRSVKENGRSRAAFIKFVSYASRNGRTLTTFSEKNINALCEKYLNMLYTQSHCFDAVNFFNDFFIFVIICYNAQIAF